MPAAALTALPGVLEGDLPRYKGIDSGLVEAGIERGLDERSRERSRCSGVVARKRGGEPRACGILEAHGEPVVHPKSAGRVATTDQTRVGTGENLQATGDWLDGVLKRNAEGREGRGMRRPLRGQQLESLL